MNNDKKDFRKFVRKLIKEEISSSERSEIKNELCKVVESVVDKVLVRNDVHKKGLSDQQCSHLFKCVMDTVDEKLNEFTTKQRPKDMKNYKDMLDKYGI